MAWSVVNEDVRTVRYTSGETSEVLYKDSTKITSFYEDVVCVEFSSDYNQNRDWANREFRIYSYCGPWFECTNPVATSRQDLIDKLNALLATNSTITIAKNGVAVGAEPTVNFIEGSNVTLTVTDNPLTDSIDVTIDASGGGGGLPPDGTYGDVVVSGTGTVWTVTDDTSNQQVAVYEDAFLRGTRPSLNFYDDGGLVSITVADNPGNNRVDIEITSTGIGTVTAVTATGLLTSSGGATPDISSFVNRQRLVGRNSATDGIMEEIFVGPGLTLSGTTLSATPPTIGYEMNFLLMGG